VARLIEVEARPTAVIAAATTWDAFPRLWRELLDEVWATMRSIEGAHPGRNVMLYKDDVPHVEVGVEVPEPFAGAGRVVGSELPGGRVVAATLRGRYEDIGLAHQEVVDEYAELGLTRLGPRWEVYGHHVEGAAGQVVDVYHLVA
jgi:effector-binding domain-containing protein